MKTALISVAFLFASAVAFAIGDITAARSAASDISAALGQDSATGQTYLRVYVVNAAGALPHAALVSAGESHTVTIKESAQLPIEGTLTSATAIGGRPCDLIVFQNGQSQLLTIAPSSTPLKNLRVAGTVSASGNPFGYDCSIVLKYTVP